jgi:hypothetical protein
MRALIVQKMRERDAWAVFGFIGLFAANYGLFNVVPGLVWIGGLCGIVGVLKCLTS